MSLSSNGNLNEATKIEKANMGNAVDKTNRDKSRDSSIDKYAELNASFLSTLTFSWLTPLMDIGYNRPLQLEDLYILNEENKCEILYEEFEKEWNNNNINNIDNNQVQQPSLVTVLYSMFGYHYMLYGLLKVLADGISVFTPIILAWLIQFVIDSQNTSISKPPVYLGYVYAIAIFLSSIIQTILLNSYYRGCMNTGFKVRTVLISALFKKALRLSPHAKQSMSTGQIVNMMSTDASRIDMLAGMFHLSWTSVILLIVVIALLINTLGVSALAGLATILLLTPIQGTFMKMAQQMRIDMVKWTDARVKLMNEILQGIKILKVYAWEDSFLDKLFDIRSNEMEFVRKSAYLKGISATIMLIGPTLMAVAAYATLGATAGELTPQAVFSALVYFGMLRFPLMFLPMTLGMIVEAKVGIDRIQKFLLAEELDTNAISYNNSEEFAINFDNASFFWDATPPSEEKEKASNVAPPSNNYKPATSSTINSLGQNLDEIAIEMSSPETTIVNTLRNITFNVKRGSLTAIVGPVGSGKSSLLNGLLGEMKLVGGNVSISGRVCYCPQQAWIQNANLKENILFGLPLDEDRYINAIKKCSLEKDLEALPDGDLTEIGEKGINLSGGQKQRVSLARSVYFDGDIFLLDDPLSAVDAHVAKHLFEEVLLGDLKNKTRLLVTHQLRYLNQVDYVVCLKDGEIAEQGTFNELMSNNNEFARMMKEYGGENDQEEEIKKIEEIKVNNVETTLTNQTKVAKQLMTQEERTTGSISIDIFYYYFNSLGHWIVPLTILITIILSQVSKTIGLAIWTVNSLNQSTVFYLVVYVLLAIAQSIFILIATISMAAIGNEGAKTLHNEALRNVLRAPMSFFDTTPIGRILNRFSKDQDTIDNLIPGYYRNVSREIKRIDAITRSPLFAHFSETLYGLSTIRAYKEQDRFVSVNNDRLNTNNQAYYFQLQSQRWLAVRIEFQGSVIILGATLIAAIFRDTISPGLIGLSISYAIGITAMLNWLIRQSVELENSMNSVERTKYYTDQLPQEAPRHINENKPPSNWPQHGQIKFNGISMKYRPGLPLVLQELSLSINKGEKIGVVGRTGAGKSSLMLALYRLIELENGSIEIDDVNISKIGLNDLRSKLSIIPQDPVIYSGTLRFNLDPFNSYSDEEIWQALDRSYLKNYVETLPGLINAEVAENGDNFSVGQRCQICLARALLRKSKILILDEATASIDMETDNLIQQTIRTDFNSQTVLTIAHRLNTIIDYDRVLVLDMGRLKEYDSPHILLSDPNSEFSHLVAETGPQNNALLKSLAAKAYESKTKIN